MLAYVMAEGVTEYTNSSNRNQVATQLAIWIVGAGHYNDEWFDRLLPPSGTDPGVAPDQDICDEARRLLATALERVQARPSFANIGDVVMSRAGSTYTVTLTDTNGNLVNGSEWGNAILAQFSSPDWEAIIDDATHSLTLTGNPGASGKEVSIIFDGSGKKGDIVFMHDPVLSTDRPLHYYFESRQSMITINTLEAAVAGQFRLLRTAPTIATSAKNPNTGNSTIAPGQSAKITDTVTYTNLNTNLEYTVKGILMDKDTDNAVLVSGQEVLSSTTFTPENMDGSVEVTFEFDASSLSGKTLVVFEELLLNDIIITDHKDLDDIGQSINVTSPSAPDENYDEPTTTPTVTPTITPTVSPTITPTVPPIITPVVTPTIIPTDTPTETSTDAPTTTPVITPASYPTYYPAVSPYAVTATPYIPGGTNSDVPPLPHLPENTLTPDGDGWIELDESGVPLGRWEWNNSEERWIFNEAVPLGDLPQTGDEGVPAFVFVLLWTSVIGLGVIWGADRRKRRRHRRF